MEWSGIGLTLGKALGGADVRSEVSGWVECMGIVGECGVSFFLSFFLSLRGVSE